MEQLQPPLTGSYHISMVWIAPALLLLYVTIRIAGARDSKRQYPLPPGPRPLPLIGNLLSAPREYQWLGFRDLCAKYGEIVCLKILGDHLIIVGSYRMAVELLEKRSRNTSDRPVITVTSLIGIDTAFSIMPYGQWWRDHRRAFWQIFHPSAVRGYQDIQRGQLHRFLMKLLESPENYRQHIRYNFSATAMQLMYGLEAKGEQDEFIATVEEAMALTSQYTTGNHPVDIFPFLRHLPGWIPGAGFQYDFARCKAAITYVKEAAFALMKAALDRGESTSCSLATLLSRIDGRSSDAQIAYQEDVIKNVGLIAFEAGSDTSYSTLVSVFLAMTLYPEVQKKAQEELDAVVGPYRLPGFEDRDALVYINAIVKEAMRWHVVLPLSVPHRTIEDDVIDGYFIPAGSMILANTWAILHDPEAYDNPEEFRPERFIRDGKLDPTVRDPYAYAFGYGRRMCAGWYFADEALYLAIASILHVFNINAPLDEQGRPVKTELRQTSGLLTYPKECRCVVTPRSEEAASLIKGAVSSA